MKVLKIKITCKLEIFLNYKIIINIKIYKLYRRPEKNEIRGSFENKRERGAISRTINRYFAA